MPLSFTSLLPLPSSIFLPSGASHRMRKPLSIILGFSETIISVFNCTNFGWFSLWICSVSWCMNKIFLFLCIWRNFLSKVTYVELKLCILFLYRTSIFFLVFQFKYQNIPKSIHIYLKSKMTQDIKFCFLKNDQNEVSFCLKHGKNTCQWGQKKSLGFPSSLFFWP